MSVTSSGSRVTAAWDTVLNQQLSFGYDDMDRLSSRTVTAGSPQSFTYSYDRWGNRVNQVAIHSGPSMSTSFSTGTNQIGNANGNTYAYDAAGNVRSDGTYTYTHDAEGNLTGVSGLTTATYVYDALNHRVETVTSAGTQQFLFDAQGKRQATLDSSGNALSEQSYLGSAPLAFFQSGSFHFQHQDWLGTERLRTSQTGTTEGTYSSLPFGDGYTATGSDQDASHFTGLDRDIETGNSHAMFRDYSSATGTWMRPDPYAGSYDLSNPQSMNRYAYVANNPLVFSDPLGLDHLLDGGCLYHDTGTFSGTGTQDDPLQPIVEIICPPSDPGIRISGPGPAPNKACSVQPATGFMQAHAADAATLAGQLHVPTSFVLALSGAESTYGTNHFATQDNNYFGMHAGAYGQAGVSASNPIVARFGAGNGFLLSGASFVHKASQLLVGVPNPQDPTQFFTAIHKAWGIGTPNYVSQFTGPRGNVAMAAIRMQCP